MKLKSMQVKNFKCIEDSTRFDICPVTCLVGQNEAGKTALLEALHKLNPDVAELGEFDVLLEYPRRRRKEYELRVGGKPDDTLITEWQVEDKDAETLEKILGAGAVKSRIVEIRKGYYPGSWWTFEGAEPLQTDSLPESAQSELEVLLPKFLYFEKCNILDGRVAIDFLIKKQQRGMLSGQERVFLALLDLVATRPEYLASIENSEELTADLEAASAPITDQIARHWSQNTSLRVCFQLHPGKPQDPPPFDEGYVLETRILNTRHNITLNFDERSTGFAWFFSFLVWFSQVKRTFGDNLFVLLDDPGIGLHARAQEDLLQYISRELEPHYQIIYTTHSPFMIRANSLGQCRTVEDIVVTSDSGEEKYLGTKVGQKILSTNPDTLIPLRAALAYEITRSMNSRKALLVASPADAMYLNWFSRRLAQENRPCLGPDWSIVPCGGGERIGAFLGLFGANEGNVVVLMDVAGGQKKLEQLPDPEILRSGRILTLDKYINTDEGGIEDLIGRSTYAGLVNLCYKLPRRHRLPVLDPLEEPKRLFRQVEEHFAAVGLGLGAFDRYRPAEFLAENARKCAKKLPDLSEAMDRFERVFAEINALQSGELDSVRPADTSGQRRRIGEITSTERASRLTQAEKV
ncbi:MAG: AAA family ATPase [Phycisphaerae bacterium]|nr:AAA family ATPase [Phycisphaerae bacterium]